MPGPVPAPKINIIPPLRSTIQLSESRVERQCAIISLVMVTILSAPVLVLNANYEPINVCNVRRAICLILDEKASLVLNGRGFIRTVSHNYPCPSIIRLDEMVKRPRAR